MGGEGGVRGKSIKGCKDFRDVSLQNTYLKPNQQLALIPKIKLVCVRWEGGGKRFEFAAVTIKKLA